MPSTITLQAPSSWPFTSPVVPARAMPSGRAYRPDANGQVEADSADAGALVGFGFTVVNDNLATAGTLVGTESVTVLQNGVPVQTTAQEIADLDTEPSTIPTVRTVSGTTDTIVAADNGNAVRYTSGSAISVDVPLGLGVGFSCLLIQTGAGVFTVSGSGGATVENRQSQLSSAGDNAVCSLFADAANHLIFSGDTA